MCTRMHALFYTYVFVMYHRYVCTELCVCVCMDYILHTLGYCPWLRCVNGYVWSIPHICMRCVSIVHDKGICRRMHQLFHTYACVMYHKYVCTQVCARVCMDLCVCTCMDLGVCVCMDHILHTLGYCPWFRCMHSYAWTILHICMRHVPQICMY